ncbi:4Fe-4S binding domain-containing protein [Anaerovirgula multivorans]|uniref:4Fe-4S binding domain-containing protein n=1 Tax=Anaerovirgula multivorans TaxID=312168 RepID=A0A239DKE2_9FIRM|nr:aldo/keto reductase [Anaerovirgula multivorans]SNS32679.1 4Fe-4S binding domain-containing protein [Anaerovirgula multivorans]
MEKNKLGNTSILVSKLCFGSLTMGPLQANLSPEEGGNLLLHAFEKGINFIDTAELYETYPHIKHGLSHWQRDQVVVATKSYAYSKITAEESLKKALLEMNTDYIDIFLLHEQESQHTIRGHYEALEYFIRMKEKGYIGAVGISTHTISAVKASLSMNEIEILHPIVNKLGLGIQDGSIEEMLKSLTEAHKLGKGIYGMKPLGGGNLLKDFQDCFHFVLNLSCLDSIAVGMQTTEEIDVNIESFEGKELNQALLDSIKRKNRKLKIDFWCEGCGNCIKTCRHNALKIIQDKVIVDPEKCVLCGYCSKSCPHFCIKVI